MFDLSNCRFQFTPKTTLQDKQILELILLSKDKITWVHSDKAYVLKSDVLKNCNFIWVKDNNIYQSSYTHKPFDYLPLLDYKEVIKNC